MTLHNVFFFFAFVFLFYDHHSSIQLNPAMTDAMGPTRFLGVTKHLYNRLCPLVGRSVGLSVDLSVTHLFDDPHVAPYWPDWPCFKSNGTRVTALFKTSAHLHVIITLFQPYTCAPHKTFQMLPKPLFSIEKMAF